MLGASNSLILLTQEEEGEDLLFLNTMSIFGQNPFDFFGILIFLKRFSLANWLRCTTDTYE